jgi:uncharacterized protein
MEQKEIQSGIPPEPAGQVEIGLLKPRPLFWTAWPTIGFGILIFIMNTIVQIIIAVVFAVAKIVSNPELDLMDFTSSLASDGLLLSAATIASSFAGIGFIILFILLRKGAPVLDYLGLRKIPRANILLFLAICVGLICLSLLVNFFFEGETDSGFTVQAYRTSVWPALFWIAAVIFAPAFEEALFRGFLFVGLKQSWLKSAGTIILTALAWALLHIQYDLYGMTTIMILGVILGIVRIKTNSLWGPLIIHSGWNLIAMIGADLYIRGLVS